MKKASIRAKHFLRDHGQGDIIFLWETFCFLFWLVNLTRRKWCYAREIVWKREIVFVCIWERKTERDFISVCEGDSVCVCVWQREREAPEKNTKTDELAKQTKKWSILSLFLKQKTFENVFANRDDRLQFWKCFFGLIFSKTTKV
jgi:hypothetical protein